MNFNNSKFLALGVTAACSVGLGLFWVYLRNSSTARITSQASSRNVPVGKNKPAGSSKKKPAAKQKPPSQKQPSKTPKFTKSEEDRIGARIKQLLDEAEIFKQKHQYAKAQKSYLELITLVEGSFGKYTGACFYSYQALAILLTQIRELSVAAQVTEKYLDIARHLPNAEDKVVEALSELAFLYFQLDRYGDSLLCNSEARSLAEKIVTAAPKSANAEAITPSKRAYIDWTIARVEHQSGELKKAEADCRSALKWIDSAPSTDSLRLDVQVTLAIILFDSEKRDEALQIFNSVATAIWERFSSDLPTLLQYVRLLVKAEMDRAVYELAVEQCQRALAIASSKDDLRDSANAIKSELSTIRRSEGREEDARELDRQILEQIRSSPSLVPPYTTSRFVTTHSSLLLPSEPSPSSSLLAREGVTRLTYHLTLKFREVLPITKSPANTLLPDKVLITVLFENPSDAAAPVKIECKKESGERQLKILSPSLEDFKVCSVYKCSVYFVDCESKQLLGEHTQYFKLFDTSADK